MTTRFIFALVFACTLTFGGAAYAAGRMGAAKALQERKGSTAAQMRGAGEKTMGKMNKMKGKMKDIMTGSPDTGSTESMSDRSSQTPK
ncbi:MAG TPA: hypothetical protein VKB53_01890 [Gammaproteobacteria bacterium]|nr:hypothetical protein [Gammaproteobacteria bacterium]